MSKLIRIGTRESQLAVWQAETVRQLLAKNHIDAELVFIKSEGDIDLQTPLYEMGVQGIFTRSLDIALLTNRVDIAVHSMKDVPTQLANGIVQAAVLERASYKDILVYKGEADAVHHALSANDGQPFTIATSSIRRKAQWLHRYPGHAIENLRGNVNTRLRKVQENDWHGAIFAAAGLERINLRPEKSIDLNWMLPAPAQGAIMVVCREDDAESREACSYFNHADTALCCGIERDFLRTLMGGCSTPISALACVAEGQVFFQGNVVSVDGKNKITVEQKAAVNEAGDLGAMAGKEILNKGADKIIEVIRNEK